MDFERKDSFCDEEPIIFFEITYIHLIQQGGKINYLTAKSLFLGWNESPFVITLTTRVFLRGSFFAIINMFTVIIGSMLIADEKLRVMRDTYEDAYIYTGNNSLQD